MTMDKNTDWLKTMYIAHRGLHDGNRDIPENSLAAFRRAADKGYAIECDVNLTKDGDIVVFHDETLSRMTGLDGHVWDHTVDELKTMRLLDTAETIPSLEDLLALVDGEVPLLIELKPKGDYIGLAEAFARKIRHYQGAYAVQSFHPYTLIWFSEHMPDVPRGQIAESFKDDTSLVFWKKFLLKRMYFNRRSTPDFINYNIHELPNRHVDRAKRQGKIVLAYCARTNEELSWMRDHYDNAVFEGFIPG
jgi:glycerophosphoryl diester phosphodiesterase